MMKQDIKRIMVVTGFLLLMGVGAVSGKQADPPSTESVTQSAGAPVASNVPPVGASISPGPQTVRGPIVANQMVPQSAAAGPLDMGASAIGDIRDIRGPLHIPDPLAWLTYVAAGFLLLFTLAWFWKWFRGQRKERVKLPFELALEQLERAKAFMKPETAVKFSVMVSDAVRKYIENRFEIEVTRHTTEEFMRRVAAEPSGEIKGYGDLLNGFLGYCDLAKFARYALTVKRMEGMLQSALHFVDATRPRPEDQKAGRKMEEGEPDVDKGMARKGPSLIRMWWGKGFGFISKKTAVPTGLEQHGAVAAGGR